MNITAEHAGGAVVLELDEGCRSVAALRSIISAALRHLKGNGFDVTVQGRAVEDVDVCGLEEGATIQVVVSRRVVALEALRAAGCDVSEDEMKNGLLMAVRRGDVACANSTLTLDVTSPGAYLSMSPRPNTFLTSAHCSCNAEPTSTSVTSATTYRCITVTGKTQQGTPCVRCF